MWRKLGCYPLLYRGFEENGENSQSKSLSVSLKLPRDMNSRHDLWNCQSFSPLRQNHTCPLHIQSLLGQMISPDLCCSRRNKSLISWRFSLAAQPGDLPVRMAGLSHTWPVPEFCAAGLGNEKCHLQLCIFSSSSVMQIPPPWACCKCFVCLCRSATNLQWSNVNTGAEDGVDRFRPRLKLTTTTRDLSKGSLLTRDVSFWVFISERIASWFVKVRLTTGTHDHQGTIDFGHGWMVFNEGLFFYNSLRNVFLFKR